LSGAEILRRHFAIKKQQRIMPLSQPGAGCHRPLNHVLVSQLMFAAQDEMDWELRDVFASVTPVMRHRQLFSN
jgi:hypothetical protein